VQLNKTNFAIFVQVYCEVQTQFVDSYATNWPVNLQVNDLQTTTQNNPDCWTWLKNMSTKIVCTSVGSTNVKMLCWVVILLP
jgi:hypothetical protein